MPEKQLLSARGQELLGLSLLAADGFTEQDIYGGDHTIQVQYQQVFVLMRAPSTEMDPPSSKTIAVTLGYRSKWSQGL